MPKSYYAKAEYEQWNEELQRHERVDRYILLTPFLVTQPTEEPITLMDLGWQPDHINHLEKYQDFDDNGRKMSGGVYIEPAEYYFE